jgi:alpha-tubulin suppressor-like RCC1 family protein
MASDLYVTGAPMRDAVSSLEANSRSGGLLPASLQTVLLKRALSGLSFDGGRGTSLLLGPQSVSAASGAVPAFETPVGPAGLGCESGTASVRGSPGRVRTGGAAVGGAAPPGLLCRLTPVVNMGRSDFVSVAARERQVLLLSSSGDVYQWHLRTSLEEGVPSVSAGAPSPGSPAFSVAPAAGGGGGGAAAAPSSPRPRSLRGVPSAPLPASTAADAGLQLVQGFLLERALRGVRVAQIACGSAHCLARAAAPFFTVYSWGSGGDGRLGHGSDRGEPAPRPVDALMAFRVTTVSAGGAHSAAITMGGVELEGLEAAELAAAGTASPAAGPLGEGEGGGGCGGRGAPLPAAVASSIRRRNRATRDGALQLGALWTWGRGANGRLGHGDGGAAALLPNRVRGMKRLRSRMLQGEGGPTQAAAAAGVTPAPAAPASSGFLPLWGFRAQPAGAAGGARVPLTDPYEVVRVGAWDPSRVGGARAGAPSPAAVWADAVLEEQGAACVAVACGGDFTVAVTADGDVWAWGASAQGQCGTTRGALERAYRALLGGGAGAPALPASSVSAGGDLLRPHRVVFGFPSYPGEAPAVVAAAATAALAAMDSPLAQMLACPWGLAPAGGGGDGGGADGGGGALARPPQRRTASTSSTASLGLEGAGDGAGAGSAPRLGISPALWACGSEHEPSTGELALREDSVRACVVAAGDAHAILVTRDGHVWAWGANDRGQTGHSTLNTAIEKPHPVPVHLFFTVAMDSGLQALQGGGGGGDGCGGRSSPHVSATFGELRADAAGGCAFDPVVGAVAGARHTVVRTASGAMLAWGANSEGACGTGDASHNASPEVVQVWEQGSGNPRLFAGGGAGGCGDSTPATTFGASAQWGAATPSLAPPKRSPSLPSLSSLSADAASARTHAVEGAPPPATPLRAASTLPRAAVLSVAAGRGFTVVLAAPAAPPAPCTTSCNSDSEDERGAPASAPAAAPLPPPRAPLAPGKIFSSVLPPDAAASLLDSGRAAVAQRRREEGVAASLTVSWDATLRSLMGSWDAFSGCDAALGRLWRVGLPPAVRARVWPLAIGNALRLTPAMLDIFSARARAVRGALQQRHITGRGGGGGGGGGGGPAPPPAFFNTEGAALVAPPSLGSPLPGGGWGAGSPSSPLAGAGTRARAPSSPFSTSLDAAPPAAAPLLQGREGSLSLIPMDLLRTFPALRLFGPPGSPSAGPLHAPVRDVLEAFACFRPDVGYVQGMSYVAAMLALHVCGTTVLANVQESRMGGAGSAAGASLTPRGAVRLLMPGGSGGGGGGAAAAFSSAASTAGLPGGGSGGAPAAAASPVGARLPFRFRVEVAEPQQGGSPDRLPAAALSGEGGSAAAGAFSPLSAAVSTSAVACEAAASERAARARFAAASPEAFSDSDTQGSASPRVGGVELSPIVEAMPPSPPPLSPPPAPPRAALLPFLVAQDRFVLFQALSNVMARHHFHVFFAMDPGPLAPYYDLFERLLAEARPAMAAHLAACGIQCEMFLFGWLQTVFLKCLPLRSAAWVWDLFLLEGVPALFRVALALMGLLEAHTAGAAGGSFEVTVQVLTQARGSGRDATARVWEEVGQLEELKREVEEVQLSHAALAMLEDIAGDPCFYRHVTL